MRAPVVHILRAADYVMGAGVALASVALTAAFADLTGLPRRCGLSRVYVGFLMHIEASARELRADYCARANVVFATTATGAGLSSLMQKRPVTAFVAGLGVMFGAMGMSVTGGALHANEIREIRTVIARLVGDDATADAIEARHRIRPPAWRDLPETAAQPADIDLALLGSDLLGGPEEEMLGGAAP